MKRPMQFAASLLIVAGSAAAVVVVSQTVGGSPGAEESVFAPTPTRTAPDDCPPTVTFPLGPEFQFEDEGPPPTPDHTPGPPPPECVPEVRQTEDAPPIPEPTRQTKVTVNGVSVELPDSATIATGEAFPATEDGKAPPDGSRHYDTFMIVYFGDSWVSFAPEGWLIASNVKPEHEEALAPLLDALQP